MKTSFQRNATIFAFTLVLAFANTFAFAQINMQKAQKAETKIEKAEMKVKGEMAKMHENAEVKIISLTQVPGEFKTKNLILEAGQYQFEVRNESVGHEVGFFIQRAEDKDGAPKETAVTNSFTTSMVAKGKVGQTGIVNLSPGEYVYSCPLNPTPHYTITVK